MAKFWSATTYPGQARYEFHQINRPESPTREGKVEGALNSAARWEPQSLRFRDGPWFRTNHR